MDNLEAKTVDLLTKLEGVATDVAPVAYEATLRAVFYDALGILAAIIALFLICACSAAFCRYVYVKTGDENSFSFGAPFGLALLSGAIGLLVLVIGTPHMLIGLLDPEAALASKIILGGGK